MEAVCADKRKICTSLPDGYISRTLIEEKYNFTQMDFDTMVSKALVCKVKGQTGLFFPLATVRNLHSVKEDKVPGDWISEQQILRSYRKRDIPDGFPKQFRDLSRYGKQDGRPGKPTYFYSPALLMDQLKLKVVENNEPFVMAKSVPFSVPVNPVMCLRVTSPPTLICFGYFGQVARNIITAVRGQEPGYPETPISRQETENLSVQQTPSKISMEAMFSSPESLQLSPITGLQTMSPINLQHEMSPLLQNDSPLSPVPYIDSTLSPLPHNDSTLPAVPHNDSTLPPVPLKSPTFSPVPQKLSKVVAVSEKTRNIYKPPYLID